MDTNDKIWILMSRALSGEISADEQRELNSILQTSPELNQQYSMLKKVWNKNFVPNDLVQEEINEKALFKKIISKGEKERQTFGSLTDNTTRSEPHIRKLLSARWLLAYAASAAILCVLFFNNVHRKSEPAGEQLIVAQNGSRSKILLPDGTTVWLNGGSKLHYDYEFNGPLREVRLEGEAFFDVVKMKSRPFIVHTGKIDIKVHGTTFNVKCYGDDKKIETTLLHGKIEVINTTDRKSPSVFLAPNQKLIIPVQQPKAVESGLKTVYELVKLDAHLKEKERIETAWIYNRMEFRGESFEELAKKLERWYNVKIEFEDEDVKLLMFNGSFEKETVDQAFSALQKVGKFEFRIEGREIFIKSSE